LVAKILNREAGSDHIMDSKTFIAVEASLVVLGAFARASAGCLVRYLHEEIINESVLPPRDFTL
jgi:hypothetical protein